MTIISWANVPWGFLKEAYYIYNINGLLYTPPLLFIIAVALWDPLLNPGITHTSVSKEWKRSLVCAISLLCSPFHLQGHEMQSCSHVNQFEPPVETCAGHFRSRFRAEGTRGKERLTLSDYKKKKTATTSGEAWRGRARGLFSGGFSGVPVFWGHFVSYFGICASAVIRSPKGAGARIAAGEALNHSPISLQSVPTFWVRAVSSCRTWSSSPVCQGFQSAFGSSWTGRLGWSQDVWNQNPQQYQNHS